jgi:hypothetical protein
MKQYNHTHTIPIGPSNALKTFINTLHLETPKAQTFAHLVENIEASYVQKSYNYETYFLTHIANAFNHKNQSFLIEKNRHTLTNNFHSTINQKVLFALAKEANTHKIIELSNALETHRHKGNANYIEKLDTHYAYKKLAKVKYLDYKNAHKTPIMLTMTLDRSFRKYIKTTNNALGEDKGLLQISDESLEVLVEKSYRALNERFREFYRFFKLKNKRSGDDDKLDYIVMFEPHKSLTLHMHVLFYCNPLQLDNLRQTWEHYLEHLSPIQHKAQDFKIIDTNRAKASTYLSKYLIKAFNDSDAMKESSFFNKFRRYFSKFKLFRTSNFYHTTQNKIDKMYGYLKEHYSDVLDTIKHSTIPMYEVFERMEIEGLFRFEINKEEVTSFNRKAIKEFYDTYKETMSDIAIKEEIYHNLDFFEKKAIRYTMAHAIFQGSMQKMINVLGYYEIPCHHWVEVGQDEVCEDRFYYQGMYAIEEMTLGKAISIINGVFDTN